MEAARRVCAAKNSTPADGGKASPYALWYGRRPTLPLDERIGRQTGIPIDVSYELTRVLEDRRKKFEKNAASRLHNKVDIEAGDMVLVTVKPRGKTAPRFDGPFRVLERIGPQLYKINRRIRNRLVIDTVNAKQLHKFRVGDKLYNIDHDHFSAPHSLTVRQSTIQDAGWGVIATSEIEAGKCIGKYKGEILDKADIQHRYPEHNAEYVVQVSDDKYIDAIDPFSSNWTRFINQKGPKDKANVRMIVDSGNVYIYDRRNSTRR